ncbi:MAG: M60 family metallopeptidase [Weeksellaceae bacterium]
MNRFLSLLFLLIGFSIHAQSPGVSSNPQQIEENIDDTDCVVNTAELQPNGANDVKAVILTNGSTASSWQPGENIEKSFDNLLNTLYHSNWNNTEFPVTLNYRLDGTTQIDYLKYIPRSDGGMNGFFGNTAISYNTVSNPDFIFLTNYDFGQSGMPEIVQFQNPITPLNIKIVVYDGYGNFASCAEMEFYKSGTTSNPAPPAGIFADALCSELMPGVTQSQINGISSQFYKSLAQCLFDQTYNKEFRVQDYEVYLPVSQIHNQLKLTGYSPFENPTGMIFNSGEKIALFVQNLSGSSGVYLKIKDFANGYSGSESFYLLKNGLNVFETGNTGLGYISYYNTNLNLADVKINIVSGIVNGYFHYLKSDNSDWQDLLSKTTYPKIDIIGKYAHLVYDRDALLIGNPNNGKELIDQYDLINRHERLLMGLYKYDRSPKNRITALGEYGGGYYAGGTGIHLDWTWGIPAMADPQGLDLWGIPHEFGHENQIRPDLKWIGTTEVTNNIYSVWVYYQMNPEGKKYTRLESESVSPGQGMPSTVGGRINGAINSTFVNGNPLQLNVDYDVFRVLVPFWQLELYYQLAGASRNAPELDFDYPGSYTGIDYARWYGTVAELSRNTNSQNMTNGELVMNFVKNSCDAVQENLIGFFTDTGFLKPIDVYIDDYGVEQLKITQSMIDDAIAYVQSKNYQQPVSPVIRYISAHSVNAFKNQLAAQGETGVGVEKTGNLLIVQNGDWKNSIAFEVYDTDNELMHVAIVGTGDISLATTRIYYPSDAKKVYAVGFDGQKILVYPDNLSTAEISNLSIKIYPNPLEKGNWLHIETQNEFEIYSVGLYVSDAKVLMEFSGNQKEIENRINQKLNELKPGVYFLNLRNSKSEVNRIKLIRK